MEASAASHPIVQSCSRRVIQSSSHPVIQSSSHPVIQSSSHPVVQSICPTDPCDTKRNGWYISPPALPHPGTRRRLGISPSQQIRSCWVVVRLFFQIVRVRNVDSRFTTRWDVSLRVMSRISGWSPGNFVGRMLGMMVFFVFSRRIYRVYGTAHGWLVGDDVSGQLNGETMGWCDGCFVGKWVF